MLRGRPCRLLLHTSRPIDLLDRLLETQAAVIVTPDEAARDQLAAADIALVMELVMEPGFEHDHDGLADRLAEIMQRRPDALLIRHARAPADIERVDAFLRVEEALSGMEDGITGLIPVVGNSGQGFASLSALAVASPRVLALALDEPALLTAIGAASISDGEAALDMARSFLQLTGAEMRLPVFSLPAEGKAGCARLAARGFSGFILREIPGKM